MIQDTEKTNVEFYYNETKDDLFAYFTEEKEWTEEAVKQLTSDKSCIENLLDLRMCYSRIGQHGSCCSEYVKECRKATEEEYKEKLDTVLKVNETINLVPYGNHCRGTKFIDASNLITPKLTDTFNTICNQIEGFNYGRMDIMFSSYDELENGINFQIVEINGAISRFENIRLANSDLDRVVDEVKQNLKTNIPEV